MQAIDTLSYTSKNKVDILVIDNAFGRAEIALFGGHILSFTPKTDNLERLWLSDKAIFDGKKAIRGGVPVCWPWFGTHASEVDLPAHGYVRTQTWQLQSYVNTNQGTVVKLQPESSTGPGFSGQAKLSLEVHVGQKLQIKLLTTNLSAQPFVYNCALHSYFKVQDIRQCELKGLTGTYKDKLQNFSLCDTPSPYRFEQETDRVHLATPTHLNITDADTHTQIESQGHDSIVVWNPWQQNAIAMPDMSSTGYSTMLCVETAITQGQVVQAGKTHVLEQVIG